MSFTPEVFADPVARLEIGVALQGLSFASKEAPVEVYADEEGFHAFALLGGRYDPPAQHWILSAGDQDLAWSEKGKTEGAFTYRAPLTSNSTVVDFTAVGPSGQLEHEAVRIETAQWEELKEKAEANPATKGKFTASASFASISFQDNRSSSVSEIALSLQGSYQQTLFNPQWFGEGAMAITALPVTGGGANIRFYQADARVGRLFQVSETMQAGAALGADFDTMSASSVNIGYQNLIGPQIYGFDKIEFSNRGALAGHLGLSTFSGDASGPIGDHRIEVGFDYRLPGDTNHPIALGATVNSIHLEVVGPSNRVIMDSTSVLIGASYKL